MWHFYLKFNLIKYLLIYHILTKYIEKSKEVRYFAIYIGNYLKQIVIVSKPQQNCCVFFQTDQLSDSFNDLLINKSEQNRKNLLLMI